MTRVLSQSVLRALHSVTIRQRGVGGRSAEHQSTGYQQRSGMSFHIALL